LLITECKDRRVIGFAYTVRSFNLTPSRLND
jgi:hypothetical protein